MGHIYSATFEGQALTTATDIWECTVAADRPVLLHQFDICQTTDLGDTSEEVIRIGLYRAVTAGSSGTAATEVAYVDGDHPAPTAAFTSLRGTASTNGTLLHAIGWNIRIPLQQIWTPETRPRIDATEDPFSLRLLAAPADSLTVSSTIIWEEL